MPRHGSGGFMMIYIVEGGGPRGARIDGPGVGHTPGVTRTCEGCHVVREEFPWAHYTPTGDSYLQ